MNVFPNYIPNKFVTIGDKYPRKMTEKIKDKNVQKNYIHKSYISNGKITFNCQKLNNIGNTISQNIVNRKQNIMIAFPKYLMIP